MQTNGLSLNAGEEDNIFTYISRLSEQDLNELYKHPFTCKALFRYLPPLARQFVLQMVISGSIPIKLLISNIKMSDKNLVDEALKTLEVKFHIISMSSAQQGLVELNPIFQETLKQCLTSDTQQVSVAVGTDPENPLKADKKPPTLTEIENFSWGQWESVLQFMISSCEQEFEFAVAIRQLLEWSHLVRTETEENTDESSTKSRITKEGFQFLLEDTKTQMWKLLRQYIDTANKRNMSRNEILQFMFELSFMECGKGYPVKLLTKTQKVMLYDLSQLGLIFRRKLKSKWFYPTQLAIGLTNVYSTSSFISPTATIPDSGPIAGGALSMESHIVVETNFRVYAYTGSPLQISLLCLFIVPEYRLPNLLVGTITRESIREAFLHGITANQILSYLTIHAHPHMKRKKNILPEVVIEQIYLWEKERSRVLFEDAVHYDKFPSLDKFRLVENFAKKNGVYLWSDERKMRLIIRKEGHKKLRPFIEENV
jgi:transcription initiation factor TFIIH subunit 4